jgi:hypothetical protein
MTSQLVGSDFTGAAQLPNYVNGRLLTAEDLATSQATLQASDSLIGRAAGHGAATGLWVTATATTLTVAPGLGMAPSGAAISLGASVTLPLTFAAPTAGATANGSFSCCMPTPAGTSTAIGVGCYLLTALPAAQLTGQAPLASPPDSTMPSGCTAQWRVQGTQFKAITVQLPDSVLGIPVTDDNRRNLLAHWCYGSEQLATLGTDPLGFAPGYGGFDTLDPSELTPDDVPLAVFYWDGQAVGFVDNWSARRRITAPDPVTASWSAVLSDRRTADGQARFLQFQDQAAELIASGAAATVTAADTFPLLPPVGFLPVGTQHAGDMLNRLRALADKIRPAEPVPDAAVNPEAEPVRDAAVNPEAKPVQGAAANPDAVLGGLAGLAPGRFDAIAKALAGQKPQQGFNTYVFFGGEASFGGVLDWEVAHLALRQSWESMPVPVISQPAPQQPALVFYLVLQNYVAVLGNPTARNAYVVFIKNYTWVNGTHLPLAPPRLGAAHE